ncbi:MAG: IclR family transcriptional regulator [Anaerolineae bacterium]
MSIQSIQRAFEILKTIDRGSGPARAAVIAEQIGLPRTTVIRILGTLEEVGAVVQISGEQNGSRQYAIGPTARLLGQLKINNLKEIARPDIEWLAAETGETVYLCTSAGDDVYYLDQVNSQHNIQLRDWVGQSLPIHTTAPGKVFLAWLTPEELDRYLAKPLKAFTPKTVTDPNQIRAYVQAIREAGYAWTHEQTEAGLIGVAGPIFGRDAELVGSVSLGGPSFRFPQPGQEQKMAELVVEVGRRISAKL